MQIHDELEILASRRKAARRGVEELTELLVSTVQRASDQGMPVEDIATHAGLAVATVKEILGESDDR